MPRSPYTSPTRDLIIEAIQKNGPMTKAALALKLDMNLVTVGSIILYTRNFVRPKVFFIADYDRHVGFKGKPSPMFGVGALDDAPLPIIDSKEIKDRYVAKFSIEERRKITNERRAKNKLKRQSDISSVVDKWKQQLDGDGNGRAASKRSERQSYSDGSNDSSTDRRRYSESGCVNTDTIWQAKAVKRINPGNS